MDSIATEALRVYENHFPHDSLWCAYYSYYSGSILLIPHFIYTPSIAPFSKHRIVCFPMNVWYSVARYLLIFLLAYAMFFFIYPFQVISMSMCSFTLTNSFSPIVRSLVQIRKYKIYESQTFYRADRFIEDWHSYSRKEINNPPDVLLTGDKDLDNAVLQYNTASLKLTPVSTKKNVAKLSETDKLKSGELFTTVKKVVEDVTFEEEDTQTVYPRDDDSTAYPKDNDKDDDDDDDDDDNNNNNNDHESDEVEEQKLPPTTPPPPQKTPRLRSIPVRRSWPRNRTSERGRLYRSSYSWRRRHSSLPGSSNRTAEAARRRREWRERREQRRAARSERSRSLPYSNAKWRTVRQQRERLDLYAKPGSAEFRRDATRHILNYAERGVCAEGRCRKFVGGVEVPYDYATEWRFYPENVDVTLITIVSLNRFQFVDAYLHQWGGPMCIVVWVHDYERDEILARLPALQNPINLTMILYEPTDDDLDYYDFPINKLRNLCIRNIRTSHFLTLDLDMWPTQTMYQQLVNLPSSILDSPHNAVVIPPIFYNSAQMASHCRSLASCISLSQKKAPKTQKEAEECVRKKLCLLSKEGGHAHMLVTKKWFNFPEHKKVAKIKCFPYQLQEPYVMLKYTENTPLYDERFVNYGYNKIQFIEQLKYYLDAFYILLHEFAVDAYHTKSPQAKEFKRSINSSQKPAMDVLWGIFRSELRTAMLRQRKKIRSCSVMREMYA